MGNDDSKKLTLARRARFVAAALASVAATTTAAGLEACGGESSESRFDDGGADTSPQPCLFVPNPNPNPCLSIDSAVPDVDLPDGGSDDDGGDGGDGGKDAEPQPCLAPRP